LTNQLGFAKFKNDKYIKTAMMKNSRLANPFKPIVGCKRAGYGGNR